jgi:hypothetical protein
MGRIGEWFCEPQKPLGRGGGGFRHTVAEGPSTGGYTAPLAGACRLLCNPVMMAHACGHVKAPARGGYTAPDRGLFQGPDERDDGMRGGSRQGPWSAGRRSRCEERTRGFGQSPLRPIGRNGRYARLPRYLGLRARARAGRGRLGEGCRDRRARGSRTHLFTRPGDFWQVSDRLG